jgi:hypothetical protein
MSFNLILFRFIMTFCAIARSLALTHIRAVWCSFVHFWSVRLLAELIVPPSVILVVAFRSGLLDCLFPSSRKPPDFLTWGAGRGATTEFLRAYFKTHSSNPFQKPIKLPKLMLRCS